MFFVSRIDKVSRPRGLVGHDKIPLNDYGVVYHVYGYIFRTITSDLWSKPASVSVGIPDYGLSSYQHTLTYKAIVSLI